MKSRKNGKNILKVEVQNISGHGFWLFVKDKEYFLTFKQFPWFKEAKVSEIQNVQLNHEHYLNWPSLDIDLELESLEKPEKYPMFYR